LAKLEPSNPQTPSNNEEVTPKEQSSSIKPETLTPSEPSNPQTPSNNEEVTPKEQSSSIKPETLTPSEPSNPQTPSNNEEVTPKGLFWIWWVKCILRYSPAGERVEGTTKTQRTQRLIDPV
jgi:hypothetical protein